MLYPGASLPCVVRIVAQSHRPFLRRDQCRVVALLGAECLSPHLNSPPHWQMVVGSGMGKFVICGTRQEKKCFALVVFLVQFTAGVVCRRLYVLILSVLRWSFDGWMKPDCKFASREVGQKGDERRGLFSGGRRAENSGVARPQTMQKLSAEP